MRYHLHFGRYPAGIWAAILSLSLSTIHGVRADVVGFLRLHVQDAATGKPLAGARIVLSDTAGIRPGWTLITDKKGEARSLPLENRDWQLVRVTLPEDSANPLTAPVDQANRTKGKAKHPTESGTSIALTPFAPEQRRIRIVADTTTEATLLIDVAHRQLARAQGTGKQVLGNQTGDTTRRDQAFIQRFPANAGNPQSLGRILQTVPRASGRGVRR